MLFVCFHNRYSKESEEIKMTDERRTQIEEIAKEYGFSFASAKRFLEEIENEVDTNEAMAEMWY